MSRKSVLFLCIHNSARSQMAEAYLKKFAGDRYEVSSAGLEPGKLNPLAVKVMEEDGIDISGNPTNDVQHFFDAGRTFDFVITVCDPKAAESCPVFPGMKKLSWSFSDPSAFTGSLEEKLQNTRVVRDQIKEAVKEFAIQSVI